jgi:hypothetical protein
VKTYRFEPSSFFNVEETLFSRCLRILGCIHLSRLIVRLALGDPT